MPIWRRTIRLGDVFRNPSMTYTERRNAIVGRLRASGWPDANSNVADLVDALSRARSADAFDRVWNAIYDHADVDRTWLDTVS